MSRENILFEKINNQTFDLHIPRTSLFENRFDEKKFLEESLNNFSIIDHEDNKNISKINLHNNYYNDATIKLMSSRFDMTYVGSKNIRELKIDNDLKLFFKNSNKRYFKDCNITKENEISIVNLKLKEIKAYTISYEREFSFYMIKQKNPGLPMVNNYIHFSLCNQDLKKFRNLSSEKNIDFEFKSNKMDNIRVTNVNKVIEFFISSSKFTKNVKYVLCQEYAFFYLNKKTELDYKIYRDTDISIFYEGLKIFKKCSISNTMELSFVNKKAPKIREHKIINEANILLFNKNNKHSFFIISNYNFEFLKQTKDKAFSTIKKVEEHWNKLDNPNKNLLKNLIQLNWSNKDDKINNFIPKNISQDISQILTMMKLRNSFKKIVEYHVI